MKTFHHIGHQEPRQPRSPFEFAKIEQVFYHCRVNRRFFWLSRFLALCYVGMCSAASGTILGELNAEQQKQILEGKQVIVLEDIEGKPWPRVRVYQTVEATPEQVAAVFFDYEKAKSFVPNILKSDVSRSISPCSKEVDYGVNVPILADEYYTVRNRLVLEGDDFYKIEWKLIRALQTKDSEGSLRIQPYQGKAVICYQNLVVPGSKVAGLLRGTAIDQMKATVKAIVEKVESQRAKNPADLDRQIAEMRAALAEEGGKKN